MALGIIHMQVSEMSPLYTLISHASHDRHHFLNQQESGFYSLTIDSSNSSSLPSRFWLFPGDLLLRGEKKNDNRKGAHQNLFMQL